MYIVEVEYNEVMYMQYGRSSDRAQVGKVRVME